MGKPTKVETGLIVLLSIVMMVIGASVHAQPNRAPLGPTIADSGTDDYRFVTFRLGSADEQRQYRVDVGIPLKPVPEEGFASLYLLDGGAAMATLDEAELATLVRREPLVLVAIRHDTPARFDGPGRAMDYTPPVKNKAIPRDHAGRAGGGADAFFALGLPGSFLDTLEGSP